MTIKYQFTWKGRMIELEFTPDDCPTYRKHYGVPMSKIIVNCDSPLPISDTGVMVNFMQNDIILKYGGPIEYIKAWLDEDAASKEWIEYEHRLLQPSLF